MTHSRTFYLFIFGIPTLVMAAFSAVLILLHVASVLTASPHGIPRESIIPGPQYLHTWELPADDATFQSSVHNEELRLTVGAEAWDDPALADPEIEYWGGTFESYRDDYQDFSASVMVRAVDADPYASGCLLVRSNEVDAGDSNGFWLCISDEHGLWGSWYDETQGEDAYDWPYIAYADYAEVINPVNEWNELKIIAKGETIWMFLNDAYAGVARHPGTQTGSIGVTIEVERDGYGTFAFRDLDIRRLGWF